MTEQWGPWIDHDGMGLPVPRGTIVRCERFDGEAIPEHPAGCARTVMGKLVIVTNVPSGAPTNTWEWAMPTYGRPQHRGIKRYRIRQFSAMTELRRLAEAPKQLEEVA